MNATKKRGRPKGSKNTDSQSQGSRGSKAIEFRLDIGDEIANLVVFKLPPKK